MLPDPYEGWSEDRLKKRCRDLARAHDHHQKIILLLAYHGGLDALPPEWRAEVDNLRKAYSDDE